MEGGLSHGCGVALSQTGFNSVGEQITEQEAMAHADKTVEVLGEFCRSRDSPSDVERDRGDDWLVFEAQNPAMDRLEQPTVEQIIENLPCYFSGRKRT